MKSDSFREFLTNRWAKENETTSMWVCRFSHSPHILVTTLRLADSLLSDLILLGGGAAVTQRSRALIESSPLLFRRSLC